MSKDNTITLGVIADDLSEAEKTHAARIEAQRFYKYATGQDLPLEYFEAVKDEAGDYIITINKGGATNEN